MLLKGAKKRKMVQKIYNVYGIDCFIIDGTAYIRIKSIEDAGFFDRIGRITSMSLIHAVGAEYSRFSFISEQLFNQFMDTAINISYKPVTDFKDMIINVVIPELKKRYVEYDNPANQYTYEEVTIFPKPLKSLAKIERLKRKAEEIKESKGKKW